VLVELLQGGRLVWVNSEDIRVLPDEEPVVVDLDDPLWWEPVRHLWQALRSTQTKLSGAEATFGMPSRGAASQPK